MHVDILILDTLITLMVQKALLLLLSTFAEGLVFSHMSPKFVNYGEYAIILNQPQPLLYTVVLWSDNVGDLQRRRESLSGSGPHDTSSTAQRWQKIRIP